MRMPRIKLRPEDDEWRAPCGCAFHYWDGAPEVIGVPFAEYGLPRPRRILAGRVDPHWHPCPGHSPQQEATK